MDSVVFNSLSRRPLQVSYVKDVPTYVKGITGHELPIPGIWALYLTDTVSGTDQYRFLVIDSSFSTTVSSFFTECHHLQLRNLIADYPRAMNGVTLEFFLGVSSTYKTPHPLPWFAGTN